ncbi:MAG: glycosyltransferase family 2 protein [Erysipelotrichaceae bacterium]|nr:glycosyltransferase family 2 protein [Erysipelotrichaceae bacterium]
MISVIIPVYNSENTISACLDSVMNQTFSDFEIVCINDGSVDNSLKILNCYQNKDQRIKVYSIENHGQAYARNYGIEKSQGDFICFIDADDSVERGYLEKLNTALTQNNSDISICGMRRIFKKKTNWLERNFMYYLPVSEEQTVRISDRPELLLSIINAPYCKLIRKSFLDKHQIKFLEGRIYEDLYFTQSLLLNNPKVSIVSSSLYRYFVYEGSTMTSKKSRHEDMYVVMRALLNEYISSDIYETVKDEVEYLTFHHVAIGTVYRSFSKHMFSFAGEVKKSRSFLKEYGFTTKNKYCYRTSWLVQLYFRVFFSFL